MKKYRIIVLALVLVLMMVACSNQKAESTAEPTDEPKKDSSLVGTWMINAVEGKGQSFNATMLAAFGIQITFDFHEDGIVDITAYGDTTSGMYTFADNVVVVTDDTGDTKGVYDPETDTIVLDDDGEMLTLVRTGSEASIEPTQEPEQTPVDMTAEKVVGTWNLSKAKANGITLPASQLGFEMSFTFNEDGSASMLYEGETTNDLTWRQDGDVVKLGAYGVDLYDFAFDGSTLTLHEDSENVDLIFSK